MSFVKDLKVWKEAEKLFMKYLVDYPNLVWLRFSQGKCTDYDIEMTTKDKVITYEVKSDTMADKTGNFVIEFRFKWEASGIYESKADFVVYYIMWEWWIQKRSELILRLWEVEKEIKRWGDGWNSELYIIKVEKLPELFEKIEMVQN